MELGNSHFVFRIGISSMNRVHLGLVAIKFPQDTYKKEKDQDLHTVSVNLEKTLLNPHIDTSISYGAPGQ